MQPEFGEIVVLASRSILRKRRNCYLLNVDEGQRLQATWLHLPGLRLHCRDKCD